MVQLPTKNTKRFSIVQNSKTNPKNFRAGLYLADRIIGPGPQHGSAIVFTGRVVSIDIVSVNQQIYSRRRERTWISQVTMNRFWPSLKLIAQVRIARGILCNLEFDNIFPNFLRGDELIDLQYMHQILSSLYLPNNLENRTMGIIEALGKPYLTRSWRLLKTSGVPYPVVQERYVKSSETLNDRNQLTSRNFESLPIREHSHAIPNQRSHLKCYGCGRRGVRRSRCPTCKPNSSRRTNSATNYVIAYAAGTRIPRLILIDINFCGEKERICADRGSLHLQRLSSTTC
ncbi:uncharacterized protein NPIL_193551 [Nephila pilipes]|uniref:CCHC-type domain-containing protein n=1 Tax=Nephila pilipes TaxID=299642 RepID=A0A8X6K5B5_NEPPI|nr:uncharacterized protein NPIL_193551 [Nephila pilipes]